MNGSRLENNQVEVIEFSWRGSDYKATLIRRPFREGGEVHLKLPDGREIIIPELGYGHKAVIEKLCAEIDIIKGFS